MSATRCVCGFECLADEEVVDHLLAVFEPVNSRGIDGREHEEWRGRACSCGFAGSAGEELDQHFLKVFTPAGSIARDGRKHGPVG